MSIRVLGAEYCPFCVRVKEHLEQNKADFIWVDTETPAGDAQKKKVSAEYNYYTIPMVFAKGEFIGGCNQFFQALKSNKINLAQGKI